QAERVLGYPCTKWTEDPHFWSEHTHPDDRSWAAQLCRRATLDRQNHDFEYRMFAADGRVVWLHDIVTVVVLDDGSCVLRGIMVDVTTRKEKESELQSAEERYRSLVENLNDIVFSTNTDGILTYISPQITRL